MNLLLIDETAAALRISRRSVYRLLDTDPNFPRPIRIGGRVVFDQAAVDEWIHDQAEAAPIERITVQLDA